MMGLCVPQFLNDLSTFPEWTMLQAPTADGIRGLATAL
jgi:hypothetical protein